MNALLRFATRLRHAETETVGYREGGGKEKGEERDRERAKKREREGEWEPDSASV